MEGAPLDRFPEEQMRGLGLGEPQVPSSAST
jgi:hypothetical protein